MSYSTPDVKIRDMNSILDSVKLMNGNETVKERMYRYVPTRYIVDRYICTLASVPFDVSLHMEEGVLDSRGFCAGL